MWPTPSIWVRPASCSQESRLMRSSQCGRAKCAFGMEGEDSLFLTGLVILGRLSPQQFVEANDDNLLAAMQIEDPEAVKNADKIASVRGVDVNFVGPADLQVAIATNPTTQGSVPSVSDPGRMQENDR